ncbi:MAG: leucine-rich repeat domain-containing protein [Clostridia bacterium]|nr:leucine-rich repeat domain-containing protein [Clostridia bacterium]
MKSKWVMGAVCACLAIALTAVCGLASAEEATDASGQWKYALEDGGAVITGYVVEPTDDLVIPGKLDGHAVTGIGISAFEGCVGLTGVTIPNSVTDIGSGAFKGCIGLTGVAIPVNVTYIGQNPFMNCRLAYIDVAPNNSVYEQRDGVLFDAQRAFLVSYPGAREGAYAIPEGIVFIGDGAFMGCAGLTGVTIPGSVTEIGFGAFLGCTGLTGVTIPSGVAHIGGWAFEGCDGLTSVTILGSVTSIGDRAFWACRGLTSATILGSMASIGDGAFHACDGLTLNVAKGSAAEQYAKEHHIPYNYICRGF